MLPKIAYKIKIQRLLVCNASQEDQQFYIHMSYPTCERFLNRSFCVGPGVINDP